MFGSVSNIFDIQAGSIQGGFNVVTRTINGFLNEFASSLGGPRL